MKLRSDRHRPVHLGRLAVERLPRGPMPDLARIAPLTALAPPAHALDIRHPIAAFQAVIDALRDGPAAPIRSVIPDDPAERACHLKAFAHFNDADLVGIAALPPEARLAVPVQNPDARALADALDAREVKSLAAGIDAILADLREAAATPPGDLSAHGHALVIAVAMPRPIRPDEPGAAWLTDAAPACAALRAAEIATVLASYLRVLGHPATAHGQSASGVCLARLAVAAGIAVGAGDGIEAPFLGRRFGLAAVTTGLSLAPDAPLAAPLPARRAPDPYRRRAFHMGPHPFERLSRVDAPTTYLDEPNIPRLPKRADLFARAQFGDLGPQVQKQATAGRYVLKAAPSAAQRRLLGALTLFQDGDPSPDAAPAAPDDHAAALKATAYWLGCDAVGISRCPDWAWYSHDARGDPIVPPHDQAISIVIDQGYDTMEGASGDDWISVAQSMRAYLRFSLLGGILAAQIRRLGHAAKAHTVTDGEVLQPPLLLLAGLGEVSRIGEVILNPFLGPRLKSGVVTTTLPLAHDRPIDFGLQRFCDSCNKCARECPSGAITAGPKTMFNGYEIWKSDSQKCATYRITTEGGAMCGRCMKTCPWNLEGLFAEAPFRWAAMHLPGAAPLLARLDDALGRGGLNPVKKWWWDLELAADGAYRPTVHPVNARTISPGLALRPEDQTLAVYPAPLAAHPYPYPDPVDREAGIRAQRAMISADAHRAANARGETAHLHRPRDPQASPVLALTVAAAEPLPGDVTAYTLVAADGASLPAWTAGAHIDVVVAPEFLRQYSLCSDPADRSRYRIAVLAEPAGRGGSTLMRRVFRPGRRVFAAPPANHFPLVEDAPFSLLLGGGIGVTPMVAMAHRLHALGRAFALHYSVPARDRAAFASALDAAPWAGRATLHVTAEGTRADLATLMAGLPRGAHVYACGPDGYMAAAMAAAATAGVPEDARHVEYFAVPDVPEAPAWPFVLELPDGARVDVAADQSAADALIDAGVRVDVKCADGLCGVCACDVADGAVDHRDHVLSASQRASRMILCRSRAAAPGGVVRIRLPDG